MNNKRCKRPPKVAMIFFIIAAFFLFGGVVMLLWNAVLPDVLPVKPVTYWQALGILVLSKILFGGFGGRRKNWGSAGAFRDRYRQMGEEERQQFKEAWKRRCSLRS